VSTIDYEIRPYRPGDETKILASFNQTFREVCGPGYVDRDLATWRWVYLQNPAGHRIFVGQADGVIAGNYSGTPQRFHTSMGPRTFVHAVDSFVLPEHRAGLKRPGLFLSIAEPWFDDVRARGDAMIYGYPVKQAERIGSKYLGYRRVRSIDYLARSASEGAIDRPADVECVLVRELGDEVDALSARFLSTKSCALIRDRAYLQWRWLAAPNAGELYEVWTARRAGELVGVMVLRPFHELLPGACTIADWCVPDADTVTTDALLAVATARARALGRAHVMAVFAEPSVEAKALLARGFVARSSAEWHERILMHRTFDPSLPEEWLIASWWYTIGDSDLV
jgi:hypothetical protein